MELFVEFASDPVVVDTPCPRFSWVVPFQGRAEFQSAYQLQAASSAELLESGRADLWDSGKVKSRQSVNIGYEGRPLSGNRDVFWRVKVWDADGNASGFSRVGTFATPLFEDSDWKGKWIGLGDPEEPFSDPDAFVTNRISPEVKAVEPDARAPMLRKEFRVAKEVRRARAYVAGVGLYEFSINGKKVGDEVLAPPRSDFRKRVIYGSYEITSLLRRGENAAGVMLGCGWFCGQKKYWGWQMQWYGSPRALVQIEIEYLDGAFERIVSDASWQGAWSPITFNCLYDGEDYDARLEQEGWNTPGFAAHGWPRANEVPAPGGRLVAATHEPGLVVETLNPVGLSEPKPGVYVFDLGKNISGWARLVIRNGTGGQAVRLRFAEALGADGMIDCASHQPARQEDHYIMKGAGLEICEPRFTYHGFQFVEVTGCPAAPDIDALAGRFVHNAVAQSGSFECSSPFINHIHRCTVQSQRCNLQMGVPTDDTQRPERIGWGADAWASAEEAMYNFWMPRFYTKWMRDFQDQQNEAGAVGMVTPRAGIEEDLVWSAAFILIPWWQYVQYGDRRILEENYPAMKRYLKYLEATGTREIADPPGGRPAKSLLPSVPVEARFPPDSEKGYLQKSQWGDHLSTTGSGMRSGMPLSIGTAFYYLDAVVFSKIARTLGHRDDAASFACLAEKIKEAFNRRFFHPQGKFYDGGIQSAQIWPLAFGLVTEENQASVFDSLLGLIRSASGHLTTGYIATKFALEVLAANGRNDLVWQLANRTDYPSWGYMLGKGRSTVTEYWDGESGSLNHVALGAALDQWFYSALAGIRADPGQPGFEHVIIEPYYPEELQWVRASVKTMRGTIVASWCRDGDSIRLDVHIPANCHATIGIPAHMEQIRESGIPVSGSKEVSLISKTKEASVFATGSGSYAFHFIPIGKHKAGWVESALSEAAIAIG